MRTNGTSSAPLGTLGRFWQTLTLTLILTLTVTLNPTLNLTLTWHTWQVLANQADDVPGIISKWGVKYPGEDLEAMAAIAKAAKSRRWVRI